MKFAPILILFFLFMIVNDAANLGTNANEAFGFASDFVHGFLTFTRNLLGDE